MCKRNFSSVRCNYRRILRFLSDKRALSDVISATMMAGTVITLSFVVFAWSQNLSSNYNHQYSQTMGAEIDRLKEKLVFEYVSNISSNKVRAYLLNCGAIDNVTIKTVYIIHSNNTVLKIFSNPPLTFIKDYGNPNQFDRRDEVYVDLYLSPVTLIYKAYYSVRIVTERGAIFDSNFVA